MPHLSTSTRAYASLRRLALGGCTLFLYMHYLTVQQIPVYCIPLPYSTVRTYARFTCIHKAMHTYLYIHNGHKAIRHVPHTIYEASILLSGVRFF